MGPWAAAGARTRAKTAARIARAIGPDFRVVHRLRRERNSPTPTAAIAPTMTAMSGRFSGGDGVVSGPLTVAPGDARAGGLRGNVLDAQTGLQSRAGTVRGTGAPLGPPGGRGPRAT